MGNAFRRQFAHGKANSLVALGVQQYDGRGVLVASLLWLDAKFAPDRLQRLRAAEQEVDPACDLDYVPNKPRETRVRAALTNSFGFGGQNTSLLVKEYVPGK